LTIQGKKTLCDQVKKETLSFINFIYTDSYFFTTLDLWILIEKYKIPSFFISSKFLLETDYQKHSFNAYGGKEAQRFVFIVIPGLRNENVPSYKLICDDKNDIFISIDKLVNAERIEELNEAMTATPTTSVEDYLKKFSKNATTNYNKKIPLPAAEVQVKRRFRYIDAPIIIGDNVPITPITPKKKVKLRILDKPRVIAESFIDEVKELKQVEADEPKKKKTKKQKAKEIQIKGEKTKTRRLNRINPIKDTSSSSLHI
jgi:hypothetical protein